MRIDKLTVKNFRGFAEQSFEFNKQFNILIGDNATGKTSILDALSIAMGSFLLGIKDVSGRHIRGEDIRYIFSKEGGRTHKRWLTPVEVKTSGFVLGKNIEWSRELKSVKGRTTAIDAKAIKSLAEKAQEKIINSENEILPLLSYYGTSRLWIQKKDTEQDARLSREALAYLNALEHESDHKMFFKWFVKNQRIERQKGSNKQLLAVKKAMLGMIDDCEDIIFDEEHEELIVKFKNGEMYLFSSLSDGQRNLLGLAADVAYRMALLNPRLEDKICETNGIVLIDELDLHLHPKWQREIVGKLKAAFSNIQFFATTHSPFIVQSADENELIDLNHTPHSGEYIGGSIEDVAENIMGVELPQISKRKQEMIDVAQHYYEALENPNNQDIEELKLKLDEMMEPFADNPAYIAFLKMQRLTRIGG